MRVPAQEIPILENLITIRHKLSALKKDREAHPDANLIIPLYKEIETQVELLNETRTGDIWNAASRNRLNDVLDDIMALLSLFFMSIGRNRESPAVYVQLVTVERYLDQLSHMGTYTDTILLENQERLNDIENILYSDASDSTFVKVLKHKLEKCKSSLSVLLANTQDVSESLKPLHEELINLRRKLALLAQKPTGYTAAEVNEIQEKLRELDNSKLQLFESNPKGKALIEGLLEQLHEESQDLKASTNSVSESLAPIVDRLKQIKLQLERLALTHKWTLRETDLYTYHLQLQEVEKLRMDGSFKDPNSDTIPEGQAVINFLLRGCYRIMAKMLSENVPVAEALMPVHNQLSTVRRCLVEVTKWGKPDSVRDLYPYQMKLASIDNMRVNGTFCDEEGNIPEGQAICVALLNECYDILHELIALADA
ncbi:peptide transporter ptr2 [Mucor velutinosus]|uniref:Peptide transporter ptr2 n=1 Tax=Mucor velutinosus TaxID=708070 RepID=A0AAN7DNE5_9FUNG|nr:peptide transporter ptr2 [Mucor velutinosus]